MSESLSGSLAAAIAIEGQIRPRRDRIVPRKFRRVAKFLWRKPAAEIAFIAKVNVRTAKRILRGEAEIPAVVMLAACREMLQPE